MALKKIILKHQNRTEALLKILPLLPSRNLLLMCENEFQCNEWYQDKILYTDLNQMLTYYFIGHVAPNRQSKSYQAILEAELDYWLKFYDLLYFGWALINIEAKRLNIDLEMIGASSPGEALKLILYNKASNDFLQCKSYHLEYSPQKVNKRLYQLEALLESDHLTEQERKEIFNDSRFRQKGEEYKTYLNSFYMFCLLIFIKHRKNSRINKRFKAFLGEVSEVNRLARRLTHAKNRRKGFAWINGIKCRRS